jgi:hypothetical protein
MLMMQHDEEVTIMIVGASKLSEMTESCETAFSVKDIAITKARAVNHPSTSTRSRTSGQHMTVVAKVMMLTVMTIHASKRRELTDAEEERLLSSMILHQ